MRQGETHPRARTPEMSRHRSCPPRASCFSAIGPVERMAGFHEVHMKTRFHEHFMCAGEDRPCVEEHVIVGLTEAVRTLKRCCGTAFNPIFRQRAAPAATTESATP